MRLTSDEIFYLNLLNSASGANARDCVVQGNVVAFLVKGSEIGKAIGKNASVIKKLRQKLKKSIEVLEYSNDAGEFIKKALYNIEVKEVNFSERDGKKYASVLLQSGEKRKVLGLISRVKRIKALAKRNYGIADIKFR